MKLIDMTGMRFVRLRVVRKDATPRMWQCICDCGVTKLVAGSNLRNGSIKSCGCLAMERASAMGSNPDFIAKRAAKATKHGHKRRGAMSAEYRTWLGMKRRCYDEKFKDYPNWGGRGIRVCDRWNESFDAFLSDMGSRPLGHSIDRIDPNGHYEPGNCRWATAQQQGGENKRSNRPVEVRGETFPTMAGAARKFGVSLSKAAGRVEAGIDVDTAFTETARLKPRRTRESYLPKSRR